MPSRNRLRYLKKYLFKKRRCCTYWLTVDGRWLTVGDAVHHQPLAVNRKKFGWANLGKYLCAVQSDYAQLKTQNSKLKT